MDGYEDAANKRELLGQSILATRTHRTPITATIAADSSLRITGQASVSSVCCNRLTLSGTQVGGAGQIVATGPQGDSVTGFAFCDRLSRVARPSWTSPMGSLWRCGAVRPIGEAGTRASKTMGALRRNPLHSIYGEEDVNLLFISKDATFGSVQGDYSATAGACAGDSGTGSLTKM